MTPESLLARCIDPGLLVLAELGGPPPSDAARRMLVAIAGQETNLIGRYQNVPAVVPGPARGWWQFERLGGVQGVLEHRASSQLARKLCDWVRVPQHPDAVWRTIEGHDVLACGFARLLLWTDPAPLPGPGDESVAWQYYLRNWRPGKPHPARWPGHWADANVAVSEAAS